MSYSIDSSICRRKGRFTPLYWSLTVLLLCAGFGRAPASAQTMQFVHVASFTPSLGPASVLAGDLNRDGKPDLVIVSNEGTGIPSNAYVLLGNGDGSFGPASSYPIGTAGNSLPGRPTLADLRGNGQLDLIAPSVGGFVNVLLGNGDGTFQPSVSYPTNNESATGVTVGDFNGDKKIDLGVAAYVTVHNGFTANVDVLLGNGDGTFGMPISTPLSQGGITTSIASGDFNRDGVLDVAGAYGLQVLLGNGNGTFQSDGTYILGATAQDIVAADFNGDGILDLAVIQSDGQLGQVSVFLGRGDGTFQTPTNVATGLGSWGMAIADVNSDGRLDLVVGTSKGFSVWLGNGDGTFSLGATVPVMGASGFTSYVAAADFNNSSHPGVAVTTSSSVFVFLQGSLPTLFPSPAVLNFAPQAPGTSSSAQTVTLTNSGTATLTLSRIGISGVSASGFAQSNNCPSTLAVNASCQVKVTSTPNAAGAQTASLNITDNAPGSPQMVGLSGTGQDFSLGVTSQTTITVTRGQAANYAVVVSAISGFSQTVDLSCSGIPPQSTCTVTPSSIAPGSVANVAVVTTPASAGLTQPAGGPSSNNPFGVWMAFSCGLGLALLPGIGRWRRKWRTQLLYGLTLLCLISIGLAMSACGGGNGGRASGETPTGTYSPVVTGTYTSGSAKLMHTVNVTLVVQ